MSDEQEWRYVPVRRLLISLEQSLAESIQWVVFEPNEEPTWSRVRQVVTDYLMGRWGNGALIGAKPNDAFFVRCDRTTMTQDDIENGRLICLVGVATIKPAEFVILRIEQLTAGAKP
jgi:uncharacterized protein